MIGAIALGLFTLWFLRLLENQEADRHWHRVYINERRRIRRG